MVERGQPDYLSYLLRLWRVRSQSDAEIAAEGMVWRASLESPHTHKRWGFANLEDLFDFLLTQTCPATRSAKSPTDSLQNQMDGV